MKRLFIPILFVVVGCQPGKEEKLPTSESGGSLLEFQAMLEEANGTYGERYQHTDPEYFKSRYTADACILPPGGVKVCSPDSIRMYFNALPPSEVDTMVVETTAVSREGGMMVEEGRYLFKGAGIEDRGKFIALWKQELGIWKLYREIWNSNPQ